MATAAPALDAAERPRRWLRVLRAELAPTPGRLNATVRIVVATAIVLVTSMTLEVPYAGLSLFIVTYLCMAAADVTTRNSVFVAIATALAMVVISFSIAVTILIFRFTIDYPPLRLGAMALFCFLGMYLARILPSRAAGFLLALIVFVSQAYVDIFPGGESAVRAMLWLWVAVAYPAAVTVAVNLVLLPADPEPLLRHEAAERLRAVARAIAAVRGSEDARNAAAALARFVQQGSAPLLKLLGLAEVRDAAVKPMRAERIAKIHLLERLVASAALLADLAVEPSPGQRARLARVAADCERFAAALSSGTGALPEPASAAGEGDEAVSALTPCLGELERVVRELPLAERPEADQPNRGAPPIAADAFTNPRYAQFGLKVTLAAMLCYVTYTAVDWFGIHTCMITCTIVALGSAGATIHKSTLRLVGCAIGGGLALASIVFVLPQMTTITQLVLLVAAVSALAGWIAMGSERTAYVGLQIAFAFYLAVFQGFVPSTDVTEVRDRLIGIVFGVVVMALVFSYLWPERTGTSMVRSLAAALRHMGKLAIGAGNLHGERAAAWQSLAEADSSAALFAFEREAFSSPGAKRGRTTRRLIDLTRRVLLAQAALAAHRERVPSAESDAALRAARAALGRAIAGALAVVAMHIDRAGPGARTEPRPPLAALVKAGRSSAHAHAAWLEGELALCTALVERIEELQLEAGLV
ncbi:MAG TPA: FUSC family protein [Burkholderiales bacterium]|nr:FUSC family protein [Burkholderiales bacterium]